MPVSIERFKAFQPNSAEAIARRNNVVTDTVNRIANRLRS